MNLTTSDALKTQIMYKANLSFAQLNEYLSFLLDCELITSAKDAGRTTYRITKKGERYLRNYRKIKHLLKMEESTIVDRFREVHAGTKGGINDV